MYYLSTYMPRYMIDAPCFKMTVVIERPYHTTVPTPCTNRYNRHQFLIKAVLPRLLPRSVLTK